MRGGEGHRVVHTIYPSRGRRERDGGERVINNGEKRVCGGRGYKMARSTTENNIARDRIENE